MSTTMEALKRNFAKPLISAAVGGFIVDASGDFGDFQVNTKIPGLSSLVNDQVWSPMMFGAVMGAASSFVAESLANILHEIDRKHRTKHLASFVTHLGSGLATWAFLPPLLAGGAINTGSKKLAGFGLVTEIASQWLHENFVEEGSFEVLNFLGN